MSIAAKCSQKYSIGNIYNYKYQLQNALIDCISISITSRCSIKKIIRLVVNLLKINQFECALLSWLLNKTNWQIMQKQIQSICKQITQRHITARKIQQKQKQKKYQFYEQHQKQNYYNNQNYFDYLVPISTLQQKFDKHIFLLLILHGYNVKSFLLTPGSQIDIDPDIFSSIPFFDQIYQNWKPEKSLKNLSLPEINKIFQNWMIQSNVYANKKKVDYNRIVDKILFLSKTYNVGANITDQGKSFINPNKQAKSQISQIIQNQGIQGRKRRKTNLQKEQLKKLKVNEDYSSKNDQKPVSSKQIYGFSPNKNQAQIQWFQDDKNNQLNRSLRRSVRTINRSIFDFRDGLQDLANSNNLILNNDSMIRSYNSNRSNNNQGDIFGSLQRTNTRNNFMNNSFNNMNSNNNNALNYSYGGFNNKNSTILGNLNKSKVQNNSNQLFGSNSLLNNIFDPFSNSQNSMINTKDQKRKQNQSSLSSQLISIKNNRNNNKQKPQALMKLKATDSFDQQSEQAQQ